MRVTDADGARQEIAMVLAKADMMMILPVMVVGMARMHVVVMTILFLPVVAMVV